MKRRSGVSTLRATARKDWAPATERPFARIGPHTLIVCAPTDDLLADDVDAAELAHRFNWHPHLVAALKLVTAADSLNRARAAANDVLLSVSGVTNS
jgi:hypothetical protein